MLKSYLEENIAMKENAPDIPATGMAVLQQQFLLVQAIEEWIATLKKELGYTCYSYQRARHIRCR